MNWDLKHDSHVQPTAGGHRLRTAAVYIWTVGVTIILGTVTIFISFFSKSGNTPHLIARLWARSILWVSGVRVTVSGSTNIDPRRSAIFMANHQSNYDIPVLLGYLPCQFRWLAKAELFRIPIFGRGMRGCGYISINRSNQQSAFESLDQAAEKVRNGVSVLIFPEGTRSMDGRIQPFKKGGFVLAVDAGVPIIPIVIYGTRSIMPKKRLRILPGEVHLDIRPPVDTSGFTRENKERLMDDIKTIMCEAFTPSQKETACH